MRDTTHADIKRAEIVREFEKRKIEFEAEHAARKKNIETREQRTARLIDEIIIMMHPLRWLARRSDKRREGR